MSSVTNPTASRAVPADPALILDDDGGQVADLFHKIVQPPGTLSDLKLKPSSPSADPVVSKAQIPERLKHFEESYPKESRASHPDLNLALIDAKEKLNFSDRNERKQILQHVLKAAQKS